MGDPKLPKKKYKKPRHPWEADRIKQENELIKEFGLKNKREIWKAQALLRKWQTRAKTIVGLVGEERERAERILLRTLTNYGVLTEGASIDDVLRLTIRDIMERRLQTQVYKLGLALSPKQARQFIVHQKILVNSRKITSPSYLVKIGDKIEYVPGFKLVVHKPPQAQISAQTEQPQEVENG